jgi:PEGA domain
MKRHIVSLAAAAFLALGASTVWAQPTQDGGGRPAGSGGGTGPGNAGSGGGSAGGGSTVSSGGGGGSAVSTSSGSTGGGSNSMGWGGRPGVDFPRADAPRRGPGAASYAESQGRTRGGGESQGRAVPRGTPAGGGDSGGNRGEGRAVPRGDAGDRGGAAGRGTTLTVDGGGRDSQGRQRSAVPAYSRPREGRTPIGTPVDRGQGVRPGGGIGIDLPWWSYGSYYGYPYGSYGYYNRYGWYPGYGFGLGYFYDPFWSGYGGYGYPYGGYGGYGGGGAGYYSSRGYDTGSLRLKVEPRDAKVYVDGYFVGVVDSFDGVFQKLAVEAGTHRVEIRADGFEPAQFEIMVTPGETITYKGQLKRMTQ